MSAARPVIRPQFSYRLANAGNALALQPPLQSPLLDQPVDQGKGDNLGGNVWKKHLKNNLSRSIVLTKPKSFWVFVHIFEKQDKDNIAVDELRGFKKLAKDFANGGIAGIEVATQNGSLKEIGHDSQE